MKFCNVLRQRRKQRMSNKEGKPTCKYPIGDPQSSNFKFCCASIEHPRFVYCDNHAKLCYINFEDIKNKPRTSFSSARKSK